MTLSFFITVIPDHDKPQPPGCLLGKITRGVVVPVAAFTGEVVPVMVMAGGMVIPVVAREQAVICQQ